MSYEQLAASVDALADVNRDLVEQVAVTQENSNAAIAIANTSADAARVSAGDALAAELSAKEAAQEAQDAANIAKDATDIMPDTATGIASGKQYFYTISEETKEVLVLWENIAGVAVDTGKRTPSAKSIADIGISTIDSKVSGVAFTVTDEDGKRTWMEADLSGGPTSWSISKIGSLLTKDNSPILATAIKDEAVAEAIAEVGFKDLPNPGLNTQSLTITDEDGKRMWLEADAAGAPTKYAASKIGEKLTAANSPTLTQDISAIASVEAAKLIGFGSLNPLNKQSIVITDEDGKRTWLEADAAGAPTSWSISKIVAALPTDIGGAPSKFKDPIKGDTKIVSGINITCFGDSMTAGAGGGGTTYTGVLQSKLQAYGSNAVVTNRGVGGENSLTIAARANGNPFIVLAPGGVIPAGTTTFTIDLQKINGFVPKPLLQGASSYKATILGVSGVFSKVTDGSTVTYNFTRDVAGSQVTFNRPAPMYLEIGEQAREDILIIWIGQNGPDTARAIQDAKAIIQHSRVLDKRFIVISKPGGTTAEDADDALWFAEFGRRFIPIRQYMVKYGLEDAGITPTAQDTTDMANGTVPTSLRTDAVHWTGPGYTILGNIVFNLIKEMEWI